MMRNVLGTVLLLGIAVAGTGCDRTAADDPAASSPSPSPAITASPQPSSIAPAATAPQAAITASPAASPGSAAPATPVALADAPLELKLVPQDGSAFYLQLPSEPYNPHFILSAPIPGNSDEVLHLIRRDHSGSGDGQMTWYRVDAVVIRPDTRQYRSFPIVNSRITDTYSTDSLWWRKPMWTADGKLLYMQPRSDDATRKLVYDLVEWDPRTFEQRVVVADAIPDTGTDFFSELRLDQTTGQVWANSFSKGRYWLLDPNSGTTTELTTTFKNSWPFSSITASPVGDRFWHFRDQAYELYDTAGHKLTDVAIGETVGGFKWSPDGKYTSWSYASQQDQRHLIYDDDMSIYASERIKLFDAQGRLVHTVSPAASAPYVDWVGWTEDGQSAILRSYRLSDQPQPPRSKIAVAWERFDIATGKRTPLKSVSDPSRLQAASFLHDAWDELIVYDSAGLQIWSPRDPAVAEWHGSIVSQPGQSELRWFEFGYNESFGTKLYRYSVGQPAPVVEAEWPKQHLNRHEYANGWLIGETYLEEGARMLYLPLK